MLAPERRTLCALRTADLGVSREDSGRLAQWGTGCRPVARFGPLKKGSGTWPETSLAATGNGALGARPEWHCRDCWGSPGVR